MLVIRLIGFSLLLNAGLVHAYCRDYIEQAESKLNYTYVCQNSLLSPPYLIIRQYIDDFEFEMFEFAYRDFRLLCSHVKLDNGRKFGGCERYGVASLKQRYANGAYTIKIGDLSSVAIDALYAKSAVFRYPELKQQVAQERCAVVVSREKTIHWRVLNEQFENLSECLLQFELFATKEKLRP